MACYGILTEGSEGMIVTELCTTPLDAFLRGDDHWRFRQHGSGSQYLTQADIDSQKLDIIMEVSSGLQRLHELHVLHRDIKAENILRAGHNGSWKICDFGEVRPCPPADHIRFDGAIILGGLSQLRGRGKGAVRRWR